MTPATQRSDLEHRMLCDRSQTAGPHVCDPIYRNGAEQVGPQTQEAHSWSPGAGRGHGDRLSFRGMRVFWNQTEVLAPPRVLRTPEGQRSAHSGWSVRSSGHSLPPSDLWKNFPGTALGKL